MLSEDIEPDSHLIARNIITEAMNLNGYEVIPGWYINPKWTCGNPATRQIEPPEEKKEIYKEYDLMCRKYLDYNLIEEIVIEIGNEDDWDTMHSSANTSKYVYRKQIGNDRDAEDWLHRIKPDAVIIRPSKGEVIALASMGNNTVYNHIKHLSRKYVKDFMIEKSTKKF